MDASNVEAGFLTLLPLDPDGSAQGLRSSFAERLGVEVAVVVTDTFGRAWRRGLTNVAIGCAGLPSLVDLRGTLDHTGRELESTLVALADEVAAASGLVMGKSSRVPAAIVRGLPVGGPFVPASELIRPPDEDLFRESPLRSISARRTIRSFDDGEVPREMIEEAVRAACTAPSPRDTRPWTFTALVSPTARRRLVRGLADTWRDDLTRDGVAEDEAARRVSALGSLLGSAPVLVVPWVRFDAMRHHRDAVRAHAEQERFLLSAGAAIQSLLLAIHAQGYGSCWTASTIFGQEMAREVVGMPSEWFALGTVAVGRVPAGAADAAPPPLDLSGLLRIL